MAVLDRPQPRPVGATTNQMEAARTELPPVTTDSDIQNTGATRAFVRLKIIGVLPAIQAGLGAAAIAEQVAPEKTQKFYQKAWEASWDIGFAAVRLFDRLIWHSAKEEPRHNDSKSSSGKPDGGSNSPPR